MIGYWESLKVTEKQAEYKVTASQLALSGRSDWMTIGQYPSHGRRYFRFQWGVGAKNLGYLHIPGGNVGAQCAQARAGEVARWIRQNRSRKDICRLIKGWTAERKAAQKKVSEAIAQKKQLELGL